MMFNIIWNTATYITSSLSKITHVTYNFISNKIQQESGSKNKGKGKDKDTKLNGKLYAFKIRDNTYKVGKTINLQQRIRSYKTIHPTGFVWHTVSCIDIHHSERILHDMLKMGGYHSIQEIFSLPGSTLIVYMNLVAELDKIINCKDDKQKLAKITHFSNKISN